MPRRRGRRCWRDHRGAAPATVRPEKDVRCPPVIAKPRDDRVDVPGEPGILEEPEVGMAGRRFHGLRRRVPRPDEGVDGFGLLIPRLCADRFEVCGREVPLHPDVGQCVAEDRAPAELGERGFIKRGLDDLPLRNQEDEAGLVRSSVDLVAVARRPLGVHGGPVLGIHVAEDDDPAPDEDVGDHGPDDANLVAREAVDAVGSRSHAATGGQATDVAADRSFHIGGAHLRAPQVTRFHSELSEYSWSIPIDRSRDLRASRDCPLASATSAPGAGSFGRTWSTRRWNLRSRKSTNPWKDSDIPAARDSRTATATRNSRERSLRARWKGMARLPPRAMKPLGSSLLGSAPPPSNEFSNSM